MPTLPRRSRSVRARTVGLLAAVLAVVGLVAGCGQEGHLLDTQGVAASAVLAQAAERTAAVETGKVQIDLTADEGTASVTGQFDTTRHVASASVTASGFGAPSDLTADVVYEAGQVYVRPDGFADLLGQTLGTPWVKVDASNLESMLPADLQIPTVDPATLLDDLRTKGIEVTEAGREDVRGVSTTHYVATIPADAVESGSPPATVDAWIDDSGLVRRVQATTQDNEYTLKAELFDLGAPVSITVPPTEDVTDLGNLGGLLGKPR
jgi:hypothetical protein